MDQGLWLSAAHVPGKENCIPDSTSMNFKDNLEWSDFWQHYSYTRFVSFSPKPEVGAVDAFALSWTELRFYTFPPFSLIAKIQGDKAEGLLMVPLWTSQAWLLQLLTMPCGSCLADTTTSGSIDITQFPPDNTHYTKKENWLHCSYYK